MTSIKPPTPTPTIHTHTHIYIYIYIAFLSFITCYLECFYIKLANEVTELCDTQSYVTKRSELVTDKYSTQYIYKIKEYGIRLEILVVTPAKLTIQYVKGY